MGTNLRTYTIRDKGHLRLSTDDVQEAVDFLGENPGHQVDDLTIPELRSRAKTERESRAEAEREAKKADRERDKAIKARAKELADPKALASAVAELEHRQGVI